MIAGEFPPKSGGIGYYVYNLSKKLVERGHTVTVITRGSETRSAKEVIDGIEVHKVAFFPFYPFHIWVHGIFVNAIFKSLQSDFTLIHLHTPLVPPIKSSLPVITTVHTPMKVDAKYHEIVDISSLAERVQSMALYPLIESRLFSISKSITAVSSSVANELKEYGLDPNKITVIGNGIDEKTFVPVHNHESPEKYVLYTGVLRARKGLFDLLDCARYVSKKHPEVRFFVCGTGPFSKKLEKEVYRRRLQKEVVLLGHVTRRKLLWLYQNATAHVVPSHYEGLPTVLLEAMSCGLPVVATEVGGNKEVISNDVNGFLVPPKSPRAMAEILLRLLSDDKLVERIGEAARKTIEKKYTWNRIANNILECYEKLLQEF